MVPSGSGDIAWLGKASRPGHGVATALQTCGAWTGEDLKAYGGVSSAYWGGGRGGYQAALINLSFPGIPGVYPWRDQSARTDEADRLVMVR